MPSAMAPLDTMITSRPSRASAASCRHHSPIARLVEAAALVGDQAGADLHDDAPRVAQQVLLRGSSGLDRAFVMASARRLGVVDLAAGEARVDLVHRRLLGHLAAPCTCWKTAFTRSSQPSRVSAEIWNTGPL